MSFNLINFFLEIKMISYFCSTELCSSLLLLLLIAVLNVHEIDGAKCTFSFVTGSAVCNNVDSFREVAQEMRSTWVNVKINNQLGGTFSMVLRGMT